MWDATRSFMLWVVIAVLTTVYLPIDFVLCAIFWNRTRSFGHAYARFWARSVIKLNPAWVVELDVARLPAGRHFVIVSNHESTADIIADLHLPHHFKFISKRNNFRVPVLGWAMILAGYIPLVRGNRHSIHECMERARWYLTHGVSVLFYPEGTRSPDGNVREFKPGAFRLAIESGVDVLPIVTTGAHLIKKNSLRFTSQRTPMKIIVGDPIPVSGLTLKDVPFLAERTRAAIIALKDGRPQTETPARVRPVGREQALHA